MVTESQKTNIKLYICKICSYAVIDIADSLVPHGKGAKDQGKVKAFKPISIFYKSSTSTSSLSASRTNFPEAQVDHHQQIKATICQQIKAELIP